MSLSSRDRISVDLRGIRSAVLACAATKGVTVSELVRDILARETQIGADAVPTPSAGISARERSIRVSLRMDCREAAVVRASARHAALPLGAYVSALVARSSSPDGWVPRAGAVADLAASCAALATLARDIRHLTQLLGQGQVQAAQEYRRLLDDIEGDVRRHLQLASEVVADLDAIRKCRRDTSLEGGDRWTTSARSTACSCGGATASSIQGTGSSVRTSSRGWGRPRPAAAATGSASGSKAPFVGHPKSWSR
jgi:hypothetical protein